MSDALDNLSNSSDPMFRIRKLKRGMGEVCCGHIERPNADMVACEGLVLEFKKCTADDDWWSVAEAYDHDGKYINAHWVWHDSWLEEA